MKQKNENENKLVAETTTSNEKKSTIIVNVARKSPKDTERSIRNKKPLFAGNVVKHIHN